jgi:class 3 adenylate cyclase
VDATLRTDNDITDADWGRMMRGYRRMFATAAASFDGTVLDAGDEGFHARFDDPTQAVRCALHLQRELDHLRQAAGVAPALRIGLHAGATDAGAGALDLALAPDGTIRSGEIVATTSLEPYVLGASAVRRRGETDLLSIHPQSTGS